MPVIRTKYQVGQVVELMGYPPHSSIRTEGYEIYAKIAAIRIDRNGIHYAFNQQSERHVSEWVSEAEIIQVYVPKQ